MVMPEGMADTYDRMADTYDRILMDHAGNSCSHFQ
jgi:hypothetical protein